MEKHILYISEKLLPFNMLQLFSVVASYHRKIFVANIKESHQFVLLLEQIYIRFLSCSIFKCLIYFKLNKNYPRLHFKGLSINNNPICRTEKKKRHRFIEQSFRLCGRRRGWDVSREQHRNKGLSKEITGSHMEEQNWHFQHRGQSIYILKMYYNQWDIQ